MTLYQLAQRPELESPTAIVAFDGWVDAGSAATTAGSLLAEGGEVVATFDNDLLFDYRSRRPVLEIVDGRPSELTWPEIALRRRRLGRRDLLVLTGHEPDYRWRALAEDVVALAKELGVVEWISLGAIPAAVPHTRAVPVLGTESRTGLLRGDVTPGPVGLLRVPAALVSVLDMAVAATGIPALGYFAQIPHYVTGPYPTAALALLEAVGAHLDGQLELAPLRVESRELRARLDAAAAADENTRSYVARLEAMADEERLPAGDDLISDIERFLRERGAPGGEGTLLN
ncbi:MAG TPA: PAC2 family protein [Candidatus Dormibacteraeota bacterium]|nr:PAC2 family protein [Candidatus Dormibacteraeota bacterium]